MNILKFRIPYKFTVACDFIVGDLHCLLDPQTNKGMRVLIIFLFFLTLMNHIFKTRAWKRELVSAKLHKK